ncbi:protein BIC1-like [Rhodamnia argentea]|uniref:Protein BIC1-like n=1 Tax=Rhodamnia argentea TaxID=178133 RepID=A0A8B8PAP2_9MYRT|nr:protein BIC1-like [Rhodamnia argentea]
MRKEGGEMGAQEGSGSGQLDASIPSSPAETRQCDGEPETLQGNGPEGDSRENEGRSGRRSSPAAPGETKNDGDGSVRPQALTDHSSGLDDSKGGGKEDKGMNGRERLKRHRVEAAGRAWIPDIWGHEELLKDWVDCSAFEASFVPAKIMLAKAALVGEGRRASSSGMRIENRC